MQMHKFTLIQLTCLLFLIVIKSTDAALAFPFLLILLVPFRLKIMPKFFDSADLAQVKSYSCGALYLWLDVYILLGNMVGIYELYCRFIIVEELFFFFIHILSST